MSRGSESPPSTSRILVVLLFATLGVVAFTHWPALSSQAVHFDDEEYWVNNPLVQNPGWSGVRRSLTEVLEMSSVDSYYQPLTMVSLIADRALGEALLGETGGYDLRQVHRGNLLLHLLNTALVALFVFALFGEPRVAALIALVFGIHPMSAESVVWISQRKTLLATFFSLACLLVYTRRVRADRRPVGIATAVFYLLALLSKPTATLLPLALLALDAWPLDRLTRRAVLEKVPLLLVTGLFSAVTFFSQTRTAAVSLPTAANLPERLLVVCHNLVFYPLKILWPADLSAYYPVPQPVDLRQPMILAGVAGSAVLAAALAVSLRRDRSWAAGWFFFVVMLLPTLGIISYTHSIAANHYVYLPWIGLLVPVAGQLVSRADGGRGRWWISALAAGLILALVPVTRAYLEPWRNTESLQRYMLSNTPRAAEVHNNLAVELRRQGRGDEALEHFRLALRYKPGYVLAVNGLASVLLERGEVDQAIEYWNLMVTQHPEYAIGHQNLGAAMLHKGDSAAARRHFEAALRLEPELVEAHAYLGALLLHQEEYPAAAQHLRQAVRLNPADGLAHTNLGVALIHLGRAHEAVASCREAVRLDPDDPVSRYNLGLALAGAGDDARAVEQYQEALRLDPGWAAARRALRRASSVEP